MAKVDAIIKSNPDYARAYLFKGYFLLQEKLEK
jgi:hypothetical protein